MAWKDLLTKYDGQTITYDAIGNPTTYRGAAMTWKGRSLASYSKNGTTITYSYDASDMRTSKTVNGVKHNYYYVEGILMYEDCSSYKLFYTYDANGFLSGIKRVLANGTTETYAVLCNMFGDVIGIYNSSKALVAKYTYDSWGKLLSITNANGAGWSRDDGPFGKKYIVERDKSRTPGNRTDAIRTAGYNYGDYSQHIRPDIKREISGRSCVVLGTSNPEVDHKNGMKNEDRVMKNEDQRLSDFQPLSKAANDAKRQFCKECKSTGIRYDAKQLGYPMSYWYGGAEHHGEEDACIGCYWHDPWEFKKHLTEKKD